MLKNIISDYKYFIFDVDGTLIDSISSVLTALKKSVETEGIFLTSNCYNKSLIGPKIFDIAKMLVPNGNTELWKNIASNFRTIYDSDPCINASIFPNVVDFLFALKKENKIVFTATNKPIIPTTKLLKHFKIYEHFIVDGESRLLCPNAIPNMDLVKSEMISYILEKITKDNSISKDSVLMVGDTSSDLNAAIKNGIDFAFFYSGYAENKDEIINNNNTKLVFKDYKELYD